MPAVSPGYVIVPRPLPDEFDRILAYSDGAVYLSESGSSTVTVVWDGNGSLDRIDLPYFKPILAVPSRDLIIFVGGPLQQSKEHIGGIPIARWNPLNANHLEYGVLEETLYPVDAVFLDREGGNDVLVIADGDSRSLVELQLGPGLLAGISHTNEVREIEPDIWAKVPRLRSQRIGLEGTQPSQFAATPTAQLLFVRFSSSSLVSVLATGKLREIAVVDNRYGEDL